jgi:hypothetical protein
LDGHAVDLLCGNSGATEIKLWLDPSLGYAARKVSCKEHMPTSPPTVTFEEYGVKRFQKKNGVFVAAEFVLTVKTPVQPEFMDCIENGKIVREPAIDENGKSIMAPAREASEEGTLTEIDLDPKFTDEDFTIKAPIPDGTEVNVEDVPRVEHVSYQWIQGKVVRVVEAAIKGKFNPKDDVKAKIATSKKIAQRADKRVLIMWGANAWPKCSALEEPFQTGLETLWPLLDDFQIVYADAMVPANRKLAAEYGLVLDNRESPCWIILDAEERVLCRQDLVAFSLNGQYDAKKIEAFLKQWAIPPKDAEKIMDDALQQAAQEHKNVFVAFVGTECDAGRRLLGIWEEHKEALNKNYVLAVLNGDRMLHYKKAESRIGYPNDPRTAMAWIAILSPTGKLLAGSIATEHVGPTVDEVDSFIKMLKQTSSHISDEQLKAIEKSFSTRGR